MRKMGQAVWLVAASLGLSVLAGAGGVPGSAAGRALGKDAGLRLSRDKNYLVIEGEKIPGGPIRINYLEAYCRPGSTDRDWHDTVIGHKTELLSASDDGKKMKLRCTVNDGVVVEHEITAGEDEVDFQVVATNPTDKPSDAHWAQPCIRLGAFTGGDEMSYLPKCFVFVDGKLTRMPFDPWATRARYVPGQVWCPAHVDRDDVNPRPLSSVVPSNGLIGCFSADEKTVFAVAFEPYQELFQGVAACLHSDFRLGGLRPGETKRVRGKMYVVPANAEALVKRYERDFPEHVKAKAGKQ